MNLRGLDTLSVRWRRPYKGFDGRLGLDARVVFSAVRGKFKQRSKLGVVKHVPGYGSQWSILYLVIVITLIALF